MRDWLRSTVGLLTVGLVAFVTFAFFAFRVITRSHLDDGHTTIAAVRDTVKVYRNSFGLPHVVASTDADAITGQGYVHAQERLWLMDVWRRFGQGRLAEILGSDAVAADVFLRSLEIPAIVARQYEALDQSTRDILIAYANGVNAYIDQHRESLSLEFDALGYQPERWKPTDCLIVGRVVAFELSLAFWNDITYAQIAALRGAGAVANYVPVSPGAPYVLDASAAAPAASST
ncbi:MAG: penicillin acylase family protein, partial [Candidatus Kapaibacteriota bacterium]